MERTVIGACLDSDKEEVVNLERASIQEWETLAIDQKISDKNLMAEFHLQAYKVHWRTKVKIISGIVA